MVPGMIKIILENSTLISENLITEQQERPLGSEKNYYSEPLDGRNEGLGRVKMSIEFGMAAAIVVMILMTRGGSERG